RAVRHQDGAAPRADPRRPSTATLQSGRLTLAALASSFSPTPVLRLGEQVGRAGWNGGATDVAAARRRFALNVGGDPVVELGFEPGCDLRVWLTEPTPA